MTCLARSIHIGIGGWDYDPWRGTFYPPGLPKARQLSFASRELTAIEINATFYKLQRPELFERWSAETPDGFVFALKGSRYCTNRKVLAGAKDAIAGFCDQGFTRLGPKLGPILWQLAATKRFEPDDVAAFLALLPRERDGLELRHAIEAQHESFRNPLFVEMAGEAGVAICMVDDRTDLMPDEPAGPFVYARLKGCGEEEPSGYPVGQIDHWAARATRWAHDPLQPREIFLFVIAGAKIRAPAAAQALIARLERETR